MSPEHDVPDEAPKNPVQRAKEAEEAAKAKLEGIEPPVPEQNPAKSSTKTSTSKTSTSKTSTSDAEKSNAQSKGSGDLIQDAADMLAAGPAVIAAPVDTEKKKASEERDTQTEDTQTEDKVVPHHKRRRVDLPKSARPKQWGMNPEDRLRVMETCLLVQRSGWRTHFSLMMFFSAAVALMGLSANSAAVVIGAMLMAPLMTPVLGIAASIAMVIGPALVRSLVTVILATAGVIVMGMVAGTFLPEGLSNEVLSRTAPDIRDLIVALAAGFAGSYATARPDVSSSLPGVAIAVALVPPLAVVGLTLEADRADLASGAMLLYVTNLAAIVFASTIMFVLTGFVPGRRLASTTPRIILGTVIALGVMAAVTVPLTLASLRASETAEERRDVEAAVDAWLGGTGDRVEDLDIDGNNISVDVVGTQPPPPTDVLEQNLATILGEEADLNVVWTAQVRPGEGEPTAEELQLAQQAAQDWALANNVEIESVTFDGVALAVTVVGSQQPSADDLEASLADIAGPNADLEIWFTQRVPLIGPAAATPTPEPTPEPEPTPTPEPTAVPTATPVPLEIPTPTPG